MKYGILLLSIYFGNPNYGTSLNVGKFILLAGGGGGGGGKKYYSQGFC